MKFDLLQIRYDEEFWIDLFGIETLLWGDGSFILINRHYDGRWSFDFLYYRLLKYIYQECKDRKRYIKLEGLL